MLDGHGCPLYHLPGPWNPEDAHRFAVRNGLGFEVRALNRAEYLDLATQAWDALPDRERRTTTSAGRPRTQAVASTGGSAPLRAGMGRPFASAPISPFPGIS
nr:hypothetical protein GCM10020093_043620 [Planobispora longispora]